MAVTPRPGGAKAVATGSRAVPDPDGAPPPSTGPRAVTTPEALRAIERLLHKYETLAELRRARARGEPIPDRSVFRALAREFPGALYELDRAPLDDIDARRSALAATVGGGAAAPWMTAMATYHALYRAALYLKVRLKKGHAPGAEEAVSLAGAAARHAAIDVGAAFVQAVAQPAGGRIGPVVLAEVASREGVPEPEARQAMFPTRRDFAEKCAKEAGR